MPLPKKIEMEVFYMMDSVVSFEGTIYEGGYGLLARSVMRDKDLKPQAKAIYAYICSFAASSNSAERSAFPSVALQCSELGMSEDTYYRHRKALEKKGYIKIEKVRGEKGKFLRNLYKIAAVPVPIADPELVDSVDKSIPANLGDGAPYPQNPGMDNPGADISGTKSTSLKSTSFKKDDDDKKIARAQFLLNSENYSLLKNLLAAKGFTTKNIKSICNKLALEGISFQLIAPIIETAISYYYEGEQRSVISSVPSFFHSQIEKAVSHFMLEKNISAEKMREFEARAASAAAAPLYNWLDSTAVYYER